MCFCSMLAIYFLISWLPTLIRMEGMPTGLSIGAAIALNIGGVIGGVLIGAAGDKVGSARELAAAYILGAIAIWLSAPVGQTEHGRESGREQVCQYLEVLVVSGQLQQKKSIKK